MAAVARGHGGDAGGDPPPGPRRIPTSCEHGSRKRGRGRSRDLKLIQAYDNNGKRPLPIEFDVNDQHTYQPIGDNDSLFIRFIGNWIGNNIPMCYVSWDSVPKNKKIGMIPWMQQYFDLTPHRTGPHWDQISKGIERLCRDRYKDRKAKQKKHFMDNGGYDDVENARKHPPVSVKKDKNPTTQELPGWIDNWRKMHTRSGEWVNDDARSCHDQMVAEKESLTQQQGSGSSTPIDESKILSKVLGEHRDHRTGRGRKLKGDSSSSMFDLSEYTTPPQRSFTNDQVRDMVSNFGAFIAHSQETRSALVQAIRNISPDADIPDIPTFSYTMPVVPPPPSTSPPIAPSSSPSPSPSSSQQISNDDDEDLGNN
ncbi:hypothetical protein OSB04_030762 [Centaurea solstitialis]|uniref:Uncharacterized protein n=1 Tax=Centaurea solstitialis TaxID=347529 RepID=A0AA38S9E4_9ASTR|nr:hypothetical protein OSB04_030762 [Centaurea solstitialis]